MTVSEGSSSYTYQERNCVSTTTVCTLLCLQAVRCVGEGSSNRTCLESVYLIVFAGFGLCHCVCRGSSSYTYQERDSVSTITVCTLLCLQAVTVTGRGRPMTAHVWREIVSVQS